ncbi:hypothetical protein HAX54_040194, partial [Datura stramonium]|nr:hypothetical protein [Datura stramonium]
IMALKGIKGIEIEVAGKGLKRLLKGTKGASSSKAKASSAKCFEEFPSINRKIHKVGAGYIFAELEECNLNL